MSVIFVRVEGFVDLEKEFEENVLNSAVYLISVAMQISNFAINYKVLMVQLFTGSIILFSNRVIRSWSAWWITSHYCIVSSSQQL